MDALALTPLARTRVELKNLRVGGAICFWFDELFHLGLTYRQYYVDSVE